MCTSNIKSHLNNHRFKVKHDAQHEKWNRRSFMQMLGLAGTGTMMLGGSNLTAASPSPLVDAISNSESDRILLIVRLKGGNDGLNTVVPLYDYDIYARKRPTIRIKENKLYKLSSDFGMDSSLKSFQSLWGDGKMKIAHGVGYENYTMSHFQGSDNYSTGMAIKADTGFLGRYFDKEYPDYLINQPKNPPAIQIGGVGDLMFEGVDTNFAFTAADASQLENIATMGDLYDVKNLPNSAYGRKLGYVRGLMNSTMTYAKVIHKSYSSSKNQVKYSNDNFAKQLAIISRIIKGGLNTKIFFVTLDGFDTHANQIDTHKKLMTEFSNGIKSFYDDLKITGDDKRVLALTISEFGRRPEENGSQGTDHGAASTSMLFGPGLEGSGFIGKHPDISKTDDKGNLKYTTNFRNLYSALLKDWLCINPWVVNKLFPEEYVNAAPLGLTCNSSKAYSNNLNSKTSVSTTSKSDSLLGTENTLSVKEDITFENGFTHTPTYRGSDTFIEFTLNSTARIRIELYNLVGQKISTIVDEVTFGGNHKIDVKSRINSQTGPGEYIYTIKTGDKRYSKILMIK